MAKTIAKISGIALAPGVSRNNRLYTREAIGKAVARAQDRIASGRRPIAMYAHHDTKSTADIAGGVTKMWQDEDGNACYEGVIADTPLGRHIAALAAPAGPDEAPPILRGLSFQGDWVGPSRYVTVERGARLETGSDLEIRRLDWTSEPGVDVAGVDSFALTGAGGESAGGYGIFESAPDARLTITEETMPVTVTETGISGEAVSAMERLAALRDTFGLVEHVLQDGFCVTCSPVGEAAQPMGKRTSGLSGPGGPYADPGYQADKKPRYQLDSKAHAKAAYSYFSMPKNAAKYTAAQVKRIKGRIMAALKKFGVKVSASESWVVDSFRIGPEAVSEHYGDGESASFSVSLNNGMVSVCVSSYCVPADDLDIIATAAMTGACAALAAMDPDMDGDVDVEGVSAASDPDGDAPGESAEDEDGRLAEAAQDPAPDPAAAITESKEPAMAETATQEAAGQALAEAQIPVSAGDPGPTGVRTGTNNLNNNDPTRNADDDVAGNSFEAFLQMMIEFIASKAGADGKINPAYAQLAAKLAMSQALGMSGPQAGSSVAMQGAGTVPAPPVSAESAQGGTVAETETDEQMVERLIRAQLAPSAPVGETRDQRIARLVEEGVARAKAQLTESGQGPSRKGLVTGPGVVQEGAVNGDYSEIPADWPQKDLSQYTPTEWKQYVEPLVAGAVFGDRGARQPA